MYNKYKIDKKDMGYSVAIGEIHALIGNPSFYLFDTCSSRPFISEGSVDLYKYDAIKLNEFTYNRTIKRSSFKDQFVLYTEDNTTSSATQPANTGSHNLTTEANGFTSASLLINDVRILKILESDFGRSVDICGNLGVIGSTKFVYTLLHCDDVIRSEEGVVEIHNLSDSGSLVSSIYPRDVTDISSSFDTGLNSFGWSVSINNNFVAVGSPYTNTSGSVFIFKSGSAGYQLHSRLTPDEPNTLLYGSCLKLDKKFDRLVVGNGNVTSTGSKVYLYEYITSSNSWVKSNTFSSDREVENLNFISLPQHDVNLTQSAGFGNSVSIYCSSSSEITVAVGSPYDRIYKEYSGSDCYRNGCVYVFDLIHCQLSSSTTSYWKQTKLFGDSDAFKFNRFGHSVDIYDKNLIVSSPKYLSEFSSSYIQNTLLRSIDCDDISENDYLGMFYIYKNTDGDWNNVYSKYKPIKRYGYPYNFFAHDVCIFDENIIVGSPISITDKIGSVVCEIAAGYEHTVALKSDGTVVAWGKNDYGQTSVPVGLSGVTAIAGGAGHTVALKSDGTVVAWGSNSFGQTTVPAGLSGVTAIAAGGSHTVALKSDGSVRAWGGNFNLQSNVPASLSGVVVVAIAAGQSHTVALKQDGTVFAFTPVTDTYGLATIPSGLSGVTAIAAGYEHTVALKSDGTVVAWGRNDYGQRNVPVGLSGVTAIAAGFLHTVALKNDGTVVAWGGDQFGQVTGTPDITSPYVGISNPVTIGGQTLNGVTSIAAGLNHTVALTTDYDLTIVAWGDNSYGQATIADTINHTKLESNSSIEILGNKPDNLEVVNGNFGIYNLSDFESHHHVGNVFYKTGKMVISTNNSIFDEIFKSDVSDEPVYDISYKSSEQLYEKEIICTVNVGEFNYSTNPTSYYRPTFLLDLNKNGRFDFDDCDKILRAVYRKFTSRESWWSLFPFQFTDSIIEVDEDVERSLFYYHLSSSFENKSHVSLVEEKLTDVEYTNIINTLDDALDINSDSISDDMDIRIIWKYFINRLDATTYNKFLTSKSVGERIQFTAVIDYLNQITGKKNLPTILDSFQTRWVSGSSNQTSSYLAPYVTTIGLYDGFNLIAVAKLGTPIKNEGYFPLNFIVRFDI